MKILIKETKAAEFLSIVDKNGTEYISDFIGNTGAFTDGQFEYDDDSDAYICDQGTFDWWEKVVNENRELENRIQNLVKEHGSELVYDVVFRAGNNDLEDHANAVNQLLDDAFNNERT